MLFPLPWLIFSTLYVLALGLLVGSYLNVVIYRLPAGKSLWWPASSCRSCLEPIRWYDNIPVLSYLVLRGRCRHCQAGFSPRYALIELLTGLLFVALFVVVVALGKRDHLVPWLRTWHEVTIGFLFLAILTAKLIAATFIDFDHFIIPDEITVKGMVIGLVASCLFPFVQPLPVTSPNWLPQHTHVQGLATSLWGLVVGGGVIWTIRIVGSWVFRKEAMGFGDVTLLAMIGSFVGWQAAVLVVFLSPFPGLAVGLVQWFRKRDNVIPFGPYLSLAALAVTLFWHEIWPMANERVFEPMAFLAGMLWAETIRALGW